MFKSQLVDVLEEALQGNGVVYCPNCITVKKKKACPDFSRVAIGEVKHFSGFRGIVTTSLFAKYYYGDEKEKPNPGDEAYQKLLKEFLLNAYGSALQQEDSCLVEVDGGLEEYDYVLLPYEELFQKGFYPFSVDNVNPGEDSLFYEILRTSCGVVEVDYTFISQLFVPTKLPGIYVPFRVVGTRIRPIVHTSYLSGEFRIVPILLSAKLDGKGYAIQSRNKKLSDFTGLWKKISYNRGSVITAEEWNDLGYMLESTSFYEELFGLPYT